MHSSRKRTVRNSSRLPARGVSAPEGVPGPGGVSALGGVCSQGGVPGPGGAGGGAVCCRGCLLWGGAWSGGLLPGGVCSRGGGVILACTEADPPVNRMTDRCKIITFATSLRTVIS